MADLDEGDTDDGGVLLEETEVDAEEGDTVRLFLVDSLHFFSTVEA